MSWGEAEWFCKFHKAQLILLKDEKIRAQILDYLSVQGINKSIWIGGYLGSDSQWQWIDGTTIKLTNATQSAVTKKYGIKILQLKIIHFIFLIGWTQHNAIVSK